MIDVITFKLRLIYFVDIFLRHPVFYENLNNNIPKIFGNASKSFLEIFRVVKSCQKTEKNVFNSYSLKKLFSVNSKNLRWNWMWHIKSFH